MPIYKIADLNISIEPIFENVRKRLLPYIADSAEADFSVSASMEQINKICSNPKHPCSPENAENAIILTQICRSVLDSYEGFFFHSSSIAINNEAYVFTALSGTGKSTHTALWRKHFGDKAVMINDDKPIIRKRNGQFYIFGTPWMGKSDIGNNLKVPVKAVYILRRAKNNSVIRVTPGEVFKELLEATLVPRDKTKMATLLELFDEFFTLTPLFILNCNISDDAVLTAFNAVNNQEKGCDNK